MDEWWRESCVLGKTRRKRGKWKQKFGDPGKLQVLHKCGRETCDTWSHMYLGTYGDNLKDSYAAGTRIAPMRHPEVAAKHAAAMRGRKQLPEHVEKRAASNRGKKRSEAFRQAASSRMMGVFKGKPWSEARRAAYERSRKQCVY